MSEPNLIMNIDSAPGLPMTPNGGGTYSIDGFIDGVAWHSSPIPFDKRLDDPGVFYVGAAVLPTDSRLARRGVRGVQQQITAEGQVIVSVHLRRGPLGWFARRYIERHPLQCSVQMFRPEWDEWRNEIGIVRVEV